MLPGHILGAFPCVADMRSLFLVKRGLKFHSILAKSMMPFDVFCAHLSVLLDL